MSIECVGSVLPPAMAEWGKPERRNTKESLQGVNISFRDKALKVSKFLPETSNLKVSHFSKNLVTVSLRNRALYWSYS